MSNTNTALLWTCVPFQELTPHVLYEILRLRSEVFVLEQQCLYQDIDRLDYQSFHLCGYAGNVLVAYARILPAGVAYPEVSIGRVITSPAHRRNGFGILLMQQALLQINQMYGAVPVKIGAQQYLKRFYESFGFEDLNQPYMEDGIPHMYMLRKP
jgi:ElaA protein